MFMIFVCVLRLCQIWVKGTSFLCACLSIKAGYCLQFDYMHHDTEVMIQGVMIQYCLIWMLML